MYAKTLYKPNPPEDVLQRIKEISNRRVPHFFIYAKDKEENKVAAINNSCVNRLKEIIPKHKFKYSPGKGGRFDFHMLMNNPTLIWTDRSAEIAEEYKSCIKDIKHVKYNTEEYDNLHDYQFHELRNRMFDLDSNHRYVVDCIIVEIFSNTKSKRKVAFWGAFGDIVLENLRSNLAKEDTRVCKRCYGRYAVGSFEKDVCPFCGYQKAESVLLICENCGTEYLVNKNSRAKHQLCPQCYEEYRRNLRRKK